ncbi:H/ACA ribonucleoprotein complex non-core subunit NAF1-like [Notechis scutatus]|uniref:H/ACA ribonucleoprotein complex non-core subunit NAF1-like n=1 Tax=Notechis scutatus TaxID=8663 RepID=A0A6J1VCP2_9SAUR|nr:H/ACA ribonucleoprotein complex non-core subunit NAF1-like [Notechis scutatus]
MLTADHEEQSRGVEGRPRSLAALNRSSCSRRPRREAPPPGAAPPPPRPSPHPMRRLPPGPFRNPLGKEAGLSLETLPTGPAGEGEEAAAWAGTPWRTSPPGPTGPEAWITGLFSERRRRG